MRLKNLVNDFSRFARLPQLTLAPQDLNALVQETVLLYQEVQPRVALEFHPDPDPAAPAPGPGAGEAAAPQPAGQRPGLHHRGRHHHRLVAETIRPTAGWNSPWPTPASGVPDRDKVRIFEPYFSTKRGGTGLGLAIVNSIVAEHQGHIRVEDNVPPGRQIHYRSSHAQGRICREHLLVVDDEPQILQVVSGILQDEGFEVTHRPGWRDRPQAGGRGAPRTWCSWTSPCRAWTAWRCSAN